VLCGELHTPAALPLGKEPLAPTGQTPERVQSMKCTNVNFDNTKANTATEEVQAMKLNVVSFAGVKKKKLKHIFNKTNLQGKIKKEFHQMQHIKLILK
jgi:hypothetical protein